MCEHCNRRQFLGSAAAVGGAALAMQYLGNPAMAADAASWPAPAPVKIHVVYAGRTGDAYLTQPTEELGKFRRYFAELEKKLGDVKFVGGDMIPPADVAQVAWQ